MNNLIIRKDRFDPTGYNHLESKMFWFIFGITDEETVLLSLQYDARSICNQEVLFVEKWMMEPILRYIGVLESQETMVKHGHCGGLLGFPGGWYNQGPRIPTAD